MPVIKSSSKKALQANFHELRRGETFQRTTKKFGKRRAVAQMTAIALENQRRFRRKSSSKKRIKR